VQNVKYCKEGKESVGNGYEYWNDISIIVPKELKQRKEDENGYA